MTLGRASLEIRGEFFNIGKRPNFGGPKTSIGNASAASAANIYGRALVAAEGETSVGRKACGPI